MTVLMPSLTRAKNGDWFSRKVIPADVRDAYQRAYGVRQEERFRLTTDKSAGEAKGAFAEWMADMAMGTSEWGISPCVVPSPQEPFRAARGLETQGSEGKNIAENFSAGKIILSAARFPRARPELSP